MYLLRYAAEVKQHLLFLSAAEKKVLQKAIATQLAYQPNIPTRNRKPMAPNTLADWELRVGELRVYYEVDEDCNLVSILAIGRKIRNRVYLGGEEFTIERT